MKKLFILFIPFILQATITPWGKDSDLTYLQKTSEEKNISIPGKIANKVILFHQKVLSPTTGPRSSFRPTSSKYMELAIKKYGFLKGFIMGCDRLLRENNEEWVYQFTKIDKAKYKYDPPI